MLNQTVQEALNEQIKAELYSAYLYLAMSAHFESANLPGFAHWMRRQGHEELGHALKLFDYIAERGGQIRLKAIDQPPTTFNTPLDVFQQALDHERHVTERIHTLYGLAGNENDPATQVMLQWFITEQVEEEKVASQIVEELKMIGQQSSAIFLLDRQLGQRDKP